MLGEVIGKMRGEQMGVGLSYERVLMLQGSEGREQPSGHATTLWASGFVDNKVAFLGGRRMEAAVKLRLVIGGVLFAGISNSAT